MLLKKLSHGISAKAFFIILSVLIAFQLGVTYFYIHSEKSAQRIARRDSMIQKIINAIYLVEAMPIASRQKAVSAMSDPDLTVSLTTKPKWKKTFNAISFWEISHELRSKPEAFPLSIRLDNLHWLNLKATIGRVNWLKQFLLIAIELFIIGTIFVAIWSVSRFVKPLDDFKKAAERLGADLESGPIQVDGPSVVQETAKALNDMQNQIRKLIQDRTQMLAAISHDLRTPITRMKLRAQFMEDPTMAEEYLHDLDEMENMINETLSFAREDSEKENKVSIDLVSLVHAICIDAKEMEHHVSFSARHKRIPFLGKPVALKRAFTNLIYNAIRYANHISVSAGYEGGQAMIRIKDDGPGIPEEELDRVFSPFYRGEQSRSRDTGGVGLGLAVTRDIIEAHGGKIQLKNRSSGGLSVRVTFSVPKDGA